MNPCTYCGAPGDVLDHTIPEGVVLAAGAAGVDLSRLSRVRYLTVHACRECVAALRGQVHPSLAERRDVAKDAIRRKYRAELKTPDWTDEELADLGHVAQHDVSVALARRADARARLAWKGTSDADASFRAGYELRLATVRKLSR